MRKTILAISLLLSCILSYGQQIRTDFPDEYLDTVELKRSLKINNYSMIGVSTGITYTSAILNPKESSQIRNYVPGYWAVWYTHHEKMFDYLPYFAFTMGFAHGIEGYEFKPQGENQIVFFYPNDLCGKVEMENYEIPVMMQLHVDTDFVKYMVSLGVYGGYRTKIHRTQSPTVNYSIFRKDLDKFLQYQDDFYPWDLRFDYGLQGGVGLGLILSPFEIHFGVLARYGFGNFFTPNSKYPEDSDYADRNKIYYRFATPFDLVYNVGIHYQLSKRTGKSLRDIKRQAREIVYGAE